MRVAVIGPTGCRIQIAQFMPKETTEMVTAHLSGVCLQAEKWADRHNIPKLVVRISKAFEDQAPQYGFLRTVVSEVDLVVLFEDKSSILTQRAKAFAIQYKIPMRIIPV